MEGMGSVVKHGGRWGKDMCTPKWGWGKRGKSYGERGLKQHIHIYIHIYIYVYIGDNTPKNGESQLNKL